MVFEVLWLPQTLQTLVIKKIVLRRYFIIGHLEKCKNNECYEYCFGVIFFFFLSALLFMANLSPCFIRIWDKQKEE